MFKPVSSKVDFARMEEGVLAFWAENDTFQRSVANRAASTEYVFYDGPPFATGLPHYGHLLAGTIKDIVPRYQTMRGHRVERRFGWDCHGLPIEWKIEEQYRAKGKNKDAVPIVEFRQECRAFAQKWVDIQR